MNYNFSSIDIINIILIALGLGVCLMCLLQVLASIHLRKFVRWAFVFFFASIILYIAAHLTRMLLDGLPGTGIRVWLEIVTFIEMFSAALMAFLISRLIILLLEPSKLLKVFWFVFLGLLGAHLIILAVSAPFHAIYVFNENNVYDRGKFFQLSYVAPVLMMILIIFLLVRYRKAFERHVLIAFWVYMIAPIIAIAIQWVAYGLQFIIFATVGAAVYMFKTILQDQNVKFQAQQKEASRIETELTMASSIQADMLPSIYPAFPDRIEFDIYATMDPAREVGGDFYDFFLIDKDHLCIVVADVSGKGVPAAMFMMMSKIILSNNAMQYQSPAEILSKTNATICANNREEMFVTVWLGILEISTGKLIASNAGHEFPLLHHKDERYAYIKDKHGFVIGGMEGIQYTDYEIQLKPGSKLFLYTDGVQEAANGKRELFGAERLLKTLNENAALPPKQTLQHVRSSIDTFVNKAEQFDDITMLCLEYRGVPKTEEKEVYELKVDAKIEKLHDVISFIEELLDNKGCSKKAEMQIKLSLEEVFVNVASYAYEDKEGWAIIRAIFDENNLEIELIDGGKPYNPLEKDDPDINLSVEDRPIGGLGVFITKKQMDEVSYRFEDERNILTLKKAYK